jgi:hypothetical protein
LPKTFPINRLIRFQETQSDTSRVLLDPINKYMEKNVHGPVKALPKFFGEDNATILFLRMNPLAQMHRGAARACE